jgi:hypothetical protein
MSKVAIPRKSKNQPHDPQHSYDCGRCKFSWCCGYTCACHYKYRLPAPPDSIKRLIEKARKQAGLDPSRKEWKEYGPRQQEDSDDNPND